MKKKIVYLCGIGLLLSVFSTGCGSNQAGNGAEVATVQPTEAGNSETLAESAEPAATEQGLDENNGTSDDTDAASAGVASMKPDDGDVTGKNDTSSDQKTNSSSTSSSGKKISEDEAVKIALNKVKGAKKSDVSIHSEWDDGIEIYEGSIIYKDMEYDFEIDASNGKILDWDEEPVDHD